MGLTARLAAHLLMGYEHPPARAFVIAGQSLVQQEHPHETLPHRLVGLPQSQSRRHLRRVSDGRRARPETDGVAGMKDIRLSTSFWDHWKTVVLKAELGYSAIESLQRLWCFSAINKPDGTLTGMTIRTIEIASHWSGEPGALVGKLVELRFLDASDGVFVLHDWEDHNGWVVHSQARSDRGKKGAAARWEKKNNHLPPNGGVRDAVHH